MGQGLVQTYQHQTNAKWSITKYRRMVKSHSLWMSFGHEASFQSEEFHKLSSLLSEGSTPTEGSCFYWGGSHYRLFDGTVLSLPKGCSHTLLTEPRDNTLKISTQTATDCTPGNCPLKLSLNVETEDYEISVDPGNPFYLSVLYSTFSYQRAADQLPRTMVTLLPFLANTMASVSSRRENGFLLKFKG